MEYYPATAENLQTYTWKMMMILRTLFLLIPLAFLFSCKGGTDKSTSSLDIVKRRLFDIKSVDKVMPGKSLVYSDLANSPFFLVTLKNLSNFDLNVYYYKEYPHGAASCAEYINYPSTGECMFEADTSHLIKKNDEFIVCIYLRMPDSLFYRHEFQGVRFSILTSSENDLPFFFEKNLSNPHYLSTEPKDNRKKYVYPFQFTYWVSNDIFWENHLLVSRPPNNL